MLEWDGKPYKKRLGKAFFCLKMAVLRILCTHFEHFTRARFFWLHTDCTRVIYFTNYLIFQI